MGYAFGTIDEMGDGVFRKVRQELGVKAFGVNVLVIPPGVEARPHYHQEQDELYFVHAGRARFALPGEARELGPGGLSPVESTPTWTPTACNRKRTPNQRATQVSTRIPPARSMIPFGAAAPARNAPIPSGRRWLSFACSTETSRSPPAAAGRPTTIVILAQVGTGRKNAEPAPTSTKAIISSRCAQSRLPPARENPGQRGPAVTFSTATLEASPSRPGKTVSRNEPTALAVYIARKPMFGERTVDVQARARSGCTAAQIARPASRKRQSGVAAAEITRVPVR